MNKKRKYLLPLIVTCFLLSFPLISIRAQPSDKKRCVSFAGQNICTSDKMKIFSEGKWVWIGINGYSAASKYMLSLHPHTSVLSSDQKSKLRLRYGNLVDRVNIHYEAALVGNWGDGRFGNSRMLSKLSFMNIAGETFCNDIYIAGKLITRGIQKEPANEYLEQLKLLAHEMRHSEQCEDAGGLSSFGFLYFLQFKRANYIYANNIMEIDAWASAEDFYQRFILENKTPLRFYKDKTRPETFLAYGKGNFCRVQNSDQKNAFSGNRQILEVKNLKLSEIRTAQCGWPNGLYRISSRPGIFRLHGRGTEFDIGDGICQVNSAQMETVGGAGQVKTVPANSDLMASRNFTGACS